MSRRCARSIARLQSLHRQPACLQAFAELLPRLDSLLQYCLDARQIAITSDKVERTVEQLQLKQMGFTVSDSLTSSPASVSLLVLILYRHFYDREQLVAERRLVELADDGQPLGEDSSRSLRDIRDTIAALIVRSLLFIANAVDDEYCGAAGQLVEHFSSLSGVQHVLPKWTSAALSIRCAENDGQHSIAGRDHEDIC